MEQKKNGFIEAVASGWGEVGRRIAKLINVRSIVTLVTTWVFAALSLTGVISGKDFLQVFLIVIAFYFGTQSNKPDSNGGCTNA